ncbi:MAG: FdhF/YdeP family oxidoreductase [Actinobacteria bacterium]|nr:FdhF/YdeP family oxidoreductase [Actinomycetota bacterium]
MAKPRVDAAGGLAAMRYVLARGRDVGTLALYRRLRSRNACKTCALGMGGQEGGMVNEVGHFPEVCKKSVQAQAADMGRVITEVDLRSLSLEDLTRYSSAQMEALGRLTFPVIAGPRDTHFRRVTWEEGLTVATGAFTSSSPARTFWYTSGRSSNEAGFLLQLIARAFGTNNVNNCSYYCHQASGVALTSIYGSGTASVSLEDLEHTELVVLAGANPASNHPRLITQLIALRRRGGKVIVINPLSELGLRRFRLPSDARSFIAGSDVSDLYLQPHIGGDIALSLALLKGIMERDAIDTAFVDACTENSDEVWAHVESLTWSDLIQASGVPRDQIDAAADMISSAPSAIFMWAMGLTHHTYGTDNVRALGNLALACGFLGRPGSGLMPIRGHSNVQGIGSMGVTPSMKGAFARAMAEIYGVDTSMPPGLDTFASMTAAHQGEIDVALMLGGNLWASNPDSPWASEALSRVGTVVSLTTKLNQGHVRGRGATTVILPVLARDEEQQATTQESMFNFVRLSSGGDPNVAGEMRSEVAILAEIAHRILPADRFDWHDLTSHDALRQSIARTVPGYTAAADMTKTKREFQIAGRVFHEPRFATPTGKATFHLTELPPRVLEPGQFMLMTVRSEGQFNSVVYDEEDLYRGNLRRDVVMLAAEDAASLEVAEGDVLIVESATGSMRVHAAIVDIRAGNVAMYYPEANVLVDRAQDPESRTPAFKSVPVRLQVA